MRELIIPHSKEAEQAILGSVLLNGDAILQAIETVKVGDFFLDSHRRIYSRMLELAERGEIIDGISVSDALKAEGEFEQVGGMLYLSALLDGAGSSITGWAQIVQRKALARRLLNAGQQIANIALDDPDAESLLGDCQRLFYQACEENQPSPFVSLMDAAQEWLFEVEQQQSGTQGTGLKTGLYALDDPLGGLQRQELTVIAGRPSQGKTTLSLDAARRLGSKGAIGAYFSIEMGRRRIGERGLAGAGQMDTFAFRTARGGNNQEDRDRWAHAQRSLGKLSNCGVYVCDDASVSVLQIRARAHRLKREMEGLDFVMVDYLGLMEMSLRGGEKRYEALGDAARRLKILARELDCAVVCVAQLNRDVEKRSSPEPQLSDLADSGDIEKHTDVVVFVYRVPGGTEPDHTFIKIGKNRNGPIATREVTYVRAEHRFDN